MVREPRSSALGSRSLFVGAAGCGKTERLLQIFEKRLAVENPLEPSSYFIVPSQEHAERVIKLLITRGAPGFFSERVTTLDRLIEESFQVPNPPAISNLTRIALMRRILTEDTSVYFEKVRGKPGFLSLVLDLIGELKESCWSSEHFRKEMGRLKKLEPEAALKYEALAGVYETYDAELIKLGLRDRRDTLALYRLASAPSAQPAAKQLKFHTLCLDGFFDFTPLQIESIRELALSAEYVAAALTWDARLGAVVEPVMATKKMFELLHFRSVPMAQPQAGFSTSDPLAQPVLPRSPSHSASASSAQPVLPRYKSEDLSHLSENLFSTAIKTKPVEGGIDWFEAPDPETEAEMIARRILRQISDHECRPGDIAVLLRSVRSRRAIFESVFRRFEIPFEIHERERLSESAWIQTAVQLVQVFREGWKKEDITGFLRASFVTQVAGESKSDRALHLFETWAWKKGLRAGKETWQKAVLAESADDAEKIAAKWVEFFNKLEKDWRELKHVSQWTAYFKRVISEFGMLSFLYPSASAHAAQPALGAASAVVAQPQSINETAEAAAPGRFEKILEEVENSYGQDATAEATFDQFADDFLRACSKDSNWLSIF